MKNIGVQRAAEIVAGTAPSEFRARDLADAYWTSLSYFNVYRIVLALLFVVSTTDYGDVFDFGRRDPRLFAGVASTYLVFALLYQVLLWWRRERFNVHLSTHVATDIVALTLLSHASGGYQSGLAIMLLVTLAGAALVGRGRLIPFYAALATIAVLIEHLARTLTENLDATTFLQPALVSVAFFATALMTNFLARRVIANERIARERGLRLVDQIRVNERVIQDALDGIVVVEPDGRVRQCNRQAEVLLGPIGAGDDLAACAPHLSEALARWRAGAPGLREAIELPASGRRAHVRFADTGVPSAGGSVIYLVDESKLEEEARQHKLAALGRLTANIAHEIRNPLSAIVHAADLMEEENRVPQRIRLTRIIRDNAARLERMVHDVLELNRRDRAQVEHIALRAYVESFVREFTENEQIPVAAIEISVDDALVVEFDWVHLNQVLWNLVRNAWRHCARGPGSVLLHAATTDAEVRLHIVDDGAGVAKSLQAQLFEPFFTTYSSGTGLGLYIAQELCAANGATLEYLQRDKGADFCIVWPRTIQ